MFRIFGSTHKVDKKILEKAAKAVFSSLGTEFEVNLGFVSDRKIQELNRIYAHKDKPTDVLSFEGDVVISYKTMQKEASLWNMSINDVSVLLLVHGMLHIAGFDHKKDTERVKMEKREKEILRKINIQRG